MLDRVTTVTRPPSRPSSWAGLPRNPKLLIASVVILLSLAYLVLVGVGMTGAAVYYVTASELRAEGVPASDRLVRVGGRVMDGSIERDDRTLSLRFAMTDGAASVPVVYRGVVPDLFGYAQEGYYQDVVVEGRYTRAGVLEATQLLVSHGALVEADAQTQKQGTPPSRWQTQSAN